MALSNFSDLVTELQIEIGRSDISSGRVETLCRQVESDISNMPDFTDLDMLTKATVAIAAGDQFVTLPTGTRYIERIALSDDPQGLVYASDAYIDSSWPSGQRGRPYNYNVTSSTQLRIAPISDGDYTLNVTYGAIVTGLTASNTTNWLMTNNPLVYLYGCAYFQAIKNKDAEQTQRYGALYGGQVMNVIGSDERKRYPHKIPLAPTVVVDDGSF